MRNACLLCHTRNRQRIVARNDLDLDFALTEIAEGRRRILTNRIFQQNEQQRFHRPVQTVFIDIPITRLSKEQNTVSTRRPGLQLLLVGGIILCQNLRRPQRINRIVTELDPAVLECRGKRRNDQGVPCRMINEVLPQGLHCLVGIRYGTNVVS